MGNEGIGTAALLERIQRLERRTAAWQWLALGALGVGLLLGGVPVWAVGPQAGNPESLTAKKLIVQQLVLVDGHGHVLARLGSGAGGTGLQFQSPDGKSRWTVHVDNHMVGMFLDSASSSISMDSFNNWASIDLRDGSSRSVRLGLDLGLAGLNVSEHSSRSVTAGYFLGDVGLIVKGDKGSAGAGLDFRGYPTLSVNSDSGSLHAHIGSKGSPQLAIECWLCGPAPSTWRSVHLGYDPSFKEASPSAIQVFDGKVFHKLP